MIRRKVDPVELTLASVESRPIQYLWASHNPRELIRSARQYRPNSSRVSKGAVTSLQRIREC